MDDAIICFSFHQFCDEMKDEMTKFKLIIN